MPSAPAEQSAATGLTPARLLSLCPALATASAICVACSGGLDSTVLLHLLVQARVNSLLVASLRVFHVHHGMQLEADSWLEHCRAQCEQWQLPFTAIRVRVELHQGDSPEAAARRARYFAFEEALQPGEVLVQAHHANDQAETLLLRLLRGSGMTGLGSIPAARRLGVGRLLRPLLVVGRNQLLAYAHANRLQWIEDPSNTDTRYDRNFLRWQVIPVLQQQWPSTVNSLLRSASLAAEADGLLNELAAADLLQVHIDGFANRLSVAALQQLNPARQRNLLRHWILTQPPELQGGAPGYELLQRCISELLDPMITQPRLLAWGEGAEALQLHRYRDVLCLLRPLPPPPAAQGWTLEQALKLPAPLGSLHWREPSQMPGVPQQLELRFRVGGERIVRDDGHHQTLKNYWQQRGIPPWLRDSVPLLYHGGELVAIGDEVIAASSLGMATKKLQPLCWQRSHLLCGW